DPALEAISNLGLDVRQRMTRHALFAQPAYDFNGFNMSVRKHQRQKRSLIKTAVTNFQDCWFHAFRMAFRGLEFLRRLTARRRHKFEYLFDAPGMNKRR